MTAKVVQYSQIGDVTFVKNRRSKNIKISVKPDQSVRVSYPFYVTKTEATQFLLKNLGWIAAQQHLFSTKKTPVTAGDVLQTKLHRITFHAGKKCDTEIHNGEVGIFVDDFSKPEAAKYIENVLTVIYRREAKKILPVRLAELANQHGFVFQKVTIRNNRRNWGSCSSKNNISLNLQMMKLPYELIDYILLHELVHTQIKNHGPLFWKKLDEITGNRAKELAKQVRKFSTYTL